MLPISRKHLEVGYSSLRISKSELASEVAIAGVLKTAFSYPGFHCEVAELDTQLVGSACQDERSPIVGIGPISVAPDAQNCGIGRLLTKAMIDRVTERN